MKQVFSDDFAELVLRFSRSFSLPISVVIEKLAMHRLATVDAEIEYSGGRPGPSHVLEFAEAVEGKEPIIGTELYNLIFNTKKYELVKAEEEPQERQVNENQFCERVQEYIKEFAGGLDLPPAIILENIILERIAREQAETAIYGAEALEKPLDEFSTEEGQPVTGEKLFNLLYQIKKQEFIRDKKEEILQEQAGGVPISKEDQDFIDNN